MEYLPLGSSSGLEFSDLAGWSAGKNAARSVKTSKCGNLAAAKSLMTRRESSCFS